MKPQTLFTTTILPWLVASLPEPEAKAEAHASPAPAPQWQFLGALASAGIALGTLSALSSAAKNVGVCQCARTPACKGTKCECANEAKISCWVEKHGACKIEISACPATAKGGNGLPTPLGATYPPCGRGLPDCVNPMYCKKLDTNCASVFADGGCLGICVPRFADAPQAIQQPVPEKAPAAPAWPWMNPAKQPKQTKQPKQPQQPQQPNPYAPPAPGLCPTNFQCNAEEACIADPWKQTASYRCVSTKEICGGFRKDPCYNDKVCLKDPRMSCEGEGCTGICVGMLPDPRPI